MEGETITFSRISTNKSTTETTKYSQIPDKMTAAGDVEKLQLQYKLGLGSGLSSAWPWEFMSWEKQTDTSHAPQEMGCVLFTHPSTGHGQYQMSF